MTASSAPHHSPIKSPPAAPCDAPKSLSQKNYQRYSITSTSPLRVKSGDKNTFFASATKPGAKIYIVHKKSKIVYVGSTTQAVRSRLYGALRATGQSGYYGYKWKDLKGLTIDVWSLPSLDKLKDNKKRKIELETVEAEIAYITRHKDNNWPTCQNEIHFHPSKKLQRDIAQKIYKQTKK
jgi:hypothetical protein